MSKNHNLLETFGVYRWHSKYKMPFGTLLLQLAWIIHPCEEQFYTTIFIPLVLFFLTWMYQQKKIWKPKNFFALEYVKE